MIARARNCFPSAFAQLLGELLLDRDNFDVMIKYISDRNNLKVIMTMLRDTHQNIQYEAFHVFKARARSRHTTCLSAECQVFVANPKKTKEISDILTKNHAKLIGYLKKLHVLRTAWRRALGI